MRAVTVLVVLAVLVAVVTAQRRTVSRTDRARHCVAGRPHLVTYSVNSLDDNSIVLLDTTPGVTAVQCDIDGTRLLMAFDTMNNLNAFTGKLVPGQTFVTGSDKWNCMHSSYNVTTSVIRRVLNVQPYEQPLTLEVETTPARYDELIQDGSITVGPDEEAMAGNGPNVCTEEGRRLLAEADKTLCFGVNSDPSCQRAGQSLPVFSNQYMSIQCSNCFLGVEATLFASLQIHMFKLQQLAGGLKNIAVNGAVVLDMDAHAAWSTGVDKTLPLVKSATVLQFWVGPIPVHVWFEIPLHMTSELSFTASASATVGATASWQIGDAYVQWDSKNHWTTVSPSPQFSWTPVLSGQAQFGVDGTFALVPSIIVHLDNLFTSTLTVNPQLDLEVKADTQSKQLCAHLGYDVGITIGAELDVNINWLDIHEDKVFGPKTLYESGPRTIAQKCITV